MIHTITKTLAVSVFATIFATLAVNAIDMRGQFGSTLLASLFSAEEAPIGPCPDNMVLVTQALVPFCIDKYEASVDEDCPYANPASSEESALNLALPQCKPTSQAHAEPWRYITQAQAASACSRAGKRLVTPGEWYKASLGTPDPTQGWGEDDCNVAHNREAGAGVTGAGVRCVSDAGAYDMVGNVWEWVEGSVVNGQYEGHAMPSSGFVQGVGVDGLAYETGTAQNQTFSNDRVWTDAQIHAGIMRGGYFNSKDQAGVFATYAGSPPTFSGDAVGFRCALTVQM